jgi:coiled-coil domain-containing protein 55
MSTPPVKLSFGGLKKPITKLVGTQKKPFNTKLSFEDDDDEPIASTSKLPATTTTTTTTTAASNSRIKISTSTLSRAQKAKQAADIELDSTIYEYDEVYDNMKEGSRLAEVEKKKDAGERKVSGFPEVGIVDSR